MLLELAAGLAGGPGPDAQAWQGRARMRDQRRPLRRGRCLGEAQHRREAVGRHARMIVRPPGLAKEDERDRRHRMRHHDRRDDEQRDLPGDASRAQARQQPRRSGHGAGAAHERVTSGVNR